MSRAGALGAKTRARTSAARTRQGRAIGVAEARGVNRAGGTTARGTPR